MVGSCVLRDASGNMTEYMMGFNESEPLKYIANCTGRTCDYGIATDSQVRILLILAHSGKEIPKHDFACRPWSWFLCGDL
jgi:hypothetical protein